MKRFNAGMERLDAVFQRPHTWFAHWFQRTFGPTNFFLAKHCTIAAGIRILAVFVNYWIPVSFGATTWFDWVFGPMCLLMMVFQVVLTQRAEEAAQNGRLYFVMPFCGLWTRVILIILTFLFTPVIWRMAWEKQFWIEFFPSIGTLMALQSYFILVTPLPPGKSRVREWKEQFSAPRLTPIRTTE